VLNGNFTPAVHQTIYICIQVSAICNTKFRLSGYGRIKHWIYHRFDVHFNALSTHERWSNFNI